MAVKTVESDGAVRKYTDKQTGDQRIADNEGVRVREAGIIGRSDAGRHAQADPRAKRVPG